MEIKLPQLGEGVEEAEVLDVLVAEGDEIEAEQSIIEVETDKASAAVPCTQAGKVEKIHVAVGDVIHTGDVLLTLAEGNGDAKPDEDAEDGDAETQEAVDEDVAGESDENEAGDGEDVAEEESTSDREDSAVQADESEEEADSNSQSDQEGDEDDRQVTSSREHQDTAIADQTSETADKQHDTPVPASPAVRRFAREVDVDLDDVAGTGAGGRITREDVKAELETERPTKPPSKGEEDESPTIGEPDSDAFGEVRVERLSKLQQTMARRMQESWTTIPRVTNFDDADVTKLEELRRASKADYAEEGIRLSILPLIAKAVALTLKNHPKLNAVLDTEKDEVHFKQYVNLGIAVDTERGLVVPSLRQADLLSVGEIARRLEELAERARKSKLTREDFYGSTFTISNLGSIGGTYSTPIINPPEVAILLLGRTRRMRVFVDDDHEEPRLIMPLSLSYDHRLIDGATAARFLNELKTYLEAPTRLLMAP